MIAFEIAMMLGMVLMVSCTEKRPERPNFQKALAADSDPNISDFGSDPDSAEANPDLELAGLPTSPTEESEISIEWTADSSIRAIAYGQGASCEEPEALPRVKQGSPIVLDLTEAAEDDFSLCVIGFDGKRWLRNHISTVDIPLKRFRREISSHLKIKLPGCPEELQVLAKFTLEKKKGKIEADMDAAKAPCWKKDTKFEMTLSELSWSGQELKAVWRRGLLHAGWTSLVWTDADFQKYSAEFGYGDPNEKKAIGVLQSQSTGTQEGTP